MNFMKTGPEIIQAVNQRWLYKQWRDSRGAERLPLWNGINVDALGSIIDTLMFCDVAANGGSPRFLILYLGAQIAQCYGGEFQHRYLDEVLPPAWRDNWLENCRQSIGTSRPVYNAIDTRDRDGRLVHIESLLLPFSRDGAAADRLLASIEMFSLEGKFEQHNLGRSPHATNTNVVVATIVKD